MAEDDTKLLHDIFNRLGSVYPDLTKNATPFNNGNNGVVIDHNDGTLSKFAFSYSSVEGAAAAREDFEYEWAMLKLMDGVTFDGIEVPRPIGEIQYLDQPGADVFATYRMTKIDAQKLSVPFNEAACFYHMGRAMAQLHQGLAPLADAPALRRWREHGDLIPQLPFMDEDTNKTLAKGNSYLTANAMTGVHHGDYHFKNMIFDAQGRVIGVVDPAFMSASDNILRDFKEIPLKHRASAISGYESVTGKKLDPLLVPLTDLSRVAWKMLITSKSDAAFLNPAHKPEFDRALKSVRDLLGFTPS